MSISIGLLLAGLSYLFASGYTARSLFSGQTLNFNALLSSVVLAIVCQLVSFQSVVFSNDGLHLSFAVICILINILIVSVLTIRSLKELNLMILMVTYLFSGMLSIGLLLLPTDSIAFVGVAINSTIPLFVHVFLSLAAYCVLVIASLYAIQFRYIDAKLKAKTLSLNSHLPPLNVVENQHFRLLSLGLALLTLALVTGFLFLNNMMGKEFAHKTILSLIAWIMFAVLAFGHQRFGWRGNNSAIATIIAAVILTLAYFGSRFVREIILI